MGTSVEFIIAQTVVQRNNKGGLLCIARGEGPDMAAGGDHMFCHRQSRGTMCSASIDKRGGKRDRKRHL